MLITVQAVQVPKCWEIIKLATVKSSGVTKENQEVYLINLLQDLLSGSKTCLMGSLNDEVISCLVYSIRGEPTTGIQYLMVDNLYAFKTMPGPHWDHMWNDLCKIAGKHSCSVIACNTVHPKIEEVFTAYGGQLYTKTFYKYL